MVIGKILSVDELMESGYDAVFIGSGAGLPQLHEYPLAKVWWAYVLPMSI